MTYGTKQRGLLPWDELAVRFHYRLVLIHAFPNGNGRHARLAANLLLTQNSQALFTWGAAASVALIEDSPIRREYLTALREADRGDIARLLRFART